MKIKHVPNRKRGSRKGIEAVEAAVTLPLLTFVMFASSQIAHQVHVQTCLKIAGSEAVYAWGKVGGTQQEANRVFQEHCEALGLNDCRFVVRRVSRGGANNPDQVIRVSPRALARTNQIPLPLPISISGRWILWEDIIYRREAN